jgi:LPXTG-motif cell wall-anchored protein
MAWALVVAAGRSRTDAVDIGGLFFSQPPRALKLAFAAQIVIGLVAAIARPNTGSAFGVLAPVFGLGLMGLWGARYGRFKPRET